MLRPHHPSTPHLLCGTILALCVFSLALQACSDNPGSGVVVGENNAEMPNNNGASNQNTNDNNSNNNTDNSSSNNDTPRNNGTNNGSNNATNNATNNANNPQDLPPTADAGADETVRKRAEVELDGSASVDPEGETLTFTWTQVDGVEVALMGVETATPSFTAPSTSGSLTFELVVSDGVSASEVASVTVTVENAAPTANAGSDRETFKGQTVTLSGLGSEDLDEDPLTYAWSQREGSTVTLNETGTGEVSFVAPDVIGDLVFELEVSDGEVASSAAQVVVTVVNRPPRAVIASNDLVAPGERVTLDGSGSSDPDGDAADLTFQWVQLEGPSVELGDTTAVTVEFDAPEASSQMLFRLTVTDVDGATGAVDRTVAVGDYQGMTASFEPRPFRQHIETEGERFDVDASGGLLYIADGQSGLQIVDPTDLVSPVVVGEFATEGFASGVTVVGEVAYLAVTDPSEEGATAGTLQIVDVSDPGAPSLVGSATIPREAYSVRVAGARAVVAGLSGMTVFDITDPAAPVSQAFASARGQGVDVAYDGGLAVFLDITPSVSGTEGAARLMDISGGLNAFEVAVLDNIRARAVAVGGDYAYVGFGVDGRGGVEIFDISEPAAPVSVAEISGMGEVLAVGLDEGALFAADTDDRVHAIDLSDPTAPRVMATFQERVNLSTANLRGTIDVDRKTAYIARLGLQAGRGDLPVIRYTQLESANLSSIYDDGQITASVFVDTEANLGYAAVNNVGLRIFDVSDPAGYTVVGEADDGRLFASSIDVRGDLAAITGNNQGLHLLDVSDPSAPFLIDTVNFDGIATEVQLRGDVAYVSALFHGLHIIDISDPSNATRLGTYDTPESAVGFALNIDTAFLTSGGELITLDLLDPTSPTLLSSFQVASTIKMGVDAVGRYVFCAAGAPGLVIADALATPGAQILGRMATESEARQIDVVGNTAYMTEVGLLPRNPDRLHVIDVSNRSRPVLRGTYDMPGTPNDVAAFGAQERVFVADGERGIHELFEVTDARVDERYGVVDVGETLTYNVSVDGDLGYEIACAVTAGACTVERDRDDGTGVVTWALPGLSGHHEIAIAVGEHRVVHVAARDQVFVQ